MLCSDCGSSDCRGASSVWVCNAADIIPEINIELGDTPIVVEVGTDVTLNLPQILPRSCGTTVSGVTLVSCDSEVDDCDEFCNPANLLTGLPVVVEGGLVSADLCTTAITSPDGSGGSNVHQAIPIGVPSPALIPTVVQSTYGQRTVRARYAHENLEFSNADITLFTQAGGLEEISFSSGSRALFLHLEYAGAIATDTNILHIPANSTFSYSPAPHEERPISVGLSLYYVTDPTEVDGLTESVIVNYKYYG